MHEFVVRMTRDATTDEVIKAYRLLHVAMPELFPIHSVERKGSCLQDPPQQTLTTFYCGFLPLRIYTSFGAENVHHAYNKAAKQWGDRRANGYLTVQITKQHRLIVNQYENSFNGTTPTFTKVSHSEFTAIIKAWRSAQ